MAATKHDAIIAAIVATLLASPALASGNVDDQTNADELPEGADAAIRVTLSDSQPTADAYGRIDWLTTVRVACYIRTDKAAADGRPSSLLGAAVYARLMADKTLGGLARSIGPPRISTDIATLSTRGGVQYLDFPVRHTTTGNVIT